MTAYSDKRLAIIARQNVQAPPVERSWGPCGVLVIAAAAIVTGWAGLCTLTPSALKILEAIGVYDFSAGSAMGKISAYFGLSFGIAIAGGWIAAHLIRHVPAKRTAEAVHGG